MKIKSRLLGLLIVFSVTCFVFTSLVLAEGTTVTQNGIQFPDGTTQTTASTGGYGRWSTNGFNIYYNGGYVGIGLTNPEAPLHIVDTIGPDNMSFLSAGLGRFMLGLQIDQNIHGGTYNHLRLISTLPNQSNASSIMFETSDGSGQNERLRIASDGNVGIGTSDPKYRLDVIGDIRATGSVYYGGSSGNANGTAYNKPDFVFKEGYKVMSTEQVTKHLEQEDSLPWITSLKQEKEENGALVDMTRMSFETVEAVENLQIQIIELSKLIKELKPENEALRAENKVLREEQQTRFQKQQAEIEELRSMIKELKS